MYRYIILIISLFSLASCTLPGVQTEDQDLVQNTVLFEDESITMMVPKTWTGAKNADLPSPRIGSIKLASVSTEVKGGFSNNLIILEDTLDRIITSSRYSELNHIQTTQNYLEYTKLQDTELTFSDNEPSRLYVFEARYNQTTPRMKFVQTARVCGTKVYLLHFSLSLDKNPDIYSKLLETFTCK